MNWLKQIKPFTKNIIFNHNTRTITLVHPHFKQGQSGYKKFIQSLRDNPYSEYTVECVGMTSIKGALILSSITKHLNKLDNVEYAQLNCDLNNSVYKLYVKFL